MQQVGDIIAIGGKGLNATIDHQPLLKYILQCTNKERPKICYVPTASADRQDRIDLFYAICAQLNVEADHIGLFKNEGFEHELRAKVMQQDVFYIEGGNTRNLLALWREWKLDEMLHEAWQNGAVMSGSSAGSICWFEQGVTDSIVTELTVLQCMGWLKGSFCPHYDSEDMRQPKTLEFIQNGNMQAGYAAEDGVGFHYKNGALHQVITYFEGSKGVKISLDANGKVQEEILEAVFLK